MNDGKSPAHFDFDFGKFFSSLNFPLFNVEALMAAQRRNIEAFTHANQLAFEGLQAAAKRHTEMARGALREAEAALGAFGQPGTPEQQLKKNAELAKSSFEKGLAHARELAELVTKANTEAFKIIADRMRESFGEVTAHHAGIPEPLAPETSSSESRESDATTPKRPKAV